MFFLHLHSTFAVALRLGLIRKAVRPGQLLRGKLIFFLLWQMKALLLAVALFTFTDLIDSAT